MKSFTFVLMILKALYSKCFIESLMVRLAQEKLHCHYGHFYNIAVCIDVIYFYSGLVSHFNKFSITCWFQSIFCKNVK